MILYCKHPDGNYYKITVTEKERIKEIISLREAKMHLPWIK